MIYRCGILSVSHALTGWKTEDRSSVNAWLPAHHRVVAMKPDESLGITEFLLEGPLLLECDDLSLTGQVMITLSKDTVKNEVTARFTHEPSHTWLIPESAWPTPRTP